MTLEDSLKKLNLKQNPLNSSESILVRVSNKGKITLATSSSLNPNYCIPDGLEDILNEFYEYDNACDEEGKIIEDLNQDKFMGKLLCKQKSLITDHFKHLIPYSALEEIFLGNLSLVISSLTINGLLNEVKNNREKKNIIKIRKIEEIYYEVLQIFRNRNYQNSYSYNLLRQCSFISPLLVTISFTLPRDQANTSASSSSLLNILLLLFIYFTKIPSLFTQLKLLVFKQSSTTEEEENEEATFVALWEKLVNGSSNTNEFLYVNNHPLIGPISILNDLSILYDHKISESLLNAILPHSHLILPYLSRLSISLQSLHTLLDLLITNKNEEDKVCEILGQLVSATHYNQEVEVLKILLCTMSFERGLLELRKFEKPRDLLLVLLHRLGSIITIYPTSVSFDFDQGLEFMTATLDTPILHSFNVQPNNYAGYKILFELIDQNTNFDALINFQRSLLLERAIFSIFTQFEITKDTSIVCELGSMFSTEGVLCHSLFVIGLSLLTYINPSKTSVIFTIANNSKTFDMRRFPPLPCSKYFDFEILITTGVNNTDAFGTIYAFERLCIAGKLCCGVLLKFLRQFKDTHRKDTLKILTLNFEGRCTDVLLEMYFELMFVLLSVSDELIEVGLDESTANVFKLQVFQMFEALLEFYGTFAGYKLVVHVTKMSLKDLKLQKLAVMLLHHLVFHSTGSTKTGLGLLLIDSELVKKPLVDYLNLWNDGTEIFTDFFNLLDIPQLVTFPVAPTTLDTRKYFEQLGLFLDQSPPSNLSPASSAIRSTQPNLSIDSNMNTSTSTSDSKFNSDYGMSNVNITRYGSTPMDSKPHQHQQYGQGTSCTTTSSNGTVKSSGAGYRNSVSSSKSFTPGTPFNKNQ